MPISLEERNKIASKIDTNCCCDRFILFSLVISSIAFLNSTKENLVFIFFCRSWIPIKGLKKSKINLLIASASSRVSIFASTSLFSLFKASSGLLCVTIWYNAVPGKLNKLIASSLFLFLKIKCMCVEINLLTCFQGLSNIVSRDIIRESIFTPSSLSIWSNNLLLRSSKASSNLVRNSELSSTWESADVKNPIILGRDNCSFWYCNSSIISKSVSSNNSENIFIISLSSSKSSTPCIPNTSSIPCTL